MALKLCVLTTLVVGVLAVALAPDSPPAEAGETFPLTIEPASPTEADFITITFEGVLPNTCYDVTSSHTRSEDLIRIIVDADPGEGYCVLVLGGFSVTEEIGPLPAGSYQVTGIVYEPFPFLCTLPPCSATTAFGVTSVSVGGIAELPELARKSLEGGESSGPGAGVLAGIAGALAGGVVALGGAAWYVRGRWVR